MKKTILVICLAIFCTSFILVLNKPKNKSEMKITYKIGVAFEPTEEDIIERRKRIDERSAKEGRAPLSEEDKKRMDERIEKSKELIDEVAFELYVNKHSSLFQRVPHIKENLPEFWAACGFFYDKGVFYKNLKEEQKVQQISLNGELFNLISPEYVWTITNESKKIGEYTCYKAIATHTKEGESEEKKELTQKMVAWFTPEIPIPFGPEEVNGLPGLVLEALSLSSQKYIYTANIDTDYTEKEIAIAKGGKSIRKQAYWELAIEAARNGKYGQ